MPTRLSLTTGGFIIPHPQKVAKGGEDAYYIGERSVGVADGVGGWVCTPPLHGDRPLRPARIKPISALWTPSALFVICAKCMGSVLAGMGPARESGWCFPVANASIRLQAEIGIDPGQYARTVMREAKAAVDAFLKMDPNAILDPASILTVAHAKSTRVIGTCRPLQPGTVSSQHAPSVVVCHACGGML